MALSETKVAAMKRAAESTSQSAPDGATTEESEFKVKHLLRSYRETAEEGNTHTSV